MTTSYKDLLAQREALEQKIAQLRQSETKEAISKAQAIISEYGLSEQDVFGNRGTTSRSKTAGLKVAVKYRDPATGSTWTGRGKPPAWIKGFGPDDRAQFAV